MTRSELASRLAEIAPLSERATGLTLTVCQYDQGVPENAVWLRAERAGLGAYNAADEVDPDDAALICAAVNLVRDMITTR